MRRRLLLVAVPLVLSCGGGGAASSATTGAAATAASVSTAAVPATSTVPTDTSGVAPEGFSTVAGRVTAADGRTCDVCLWLAETGADQARGLMGVIDLGGADGMVFRYASPVTSQFWMRDTPMPLSIAFFAADGAFVSSTDMAPCLTGPDADCARYAAAGPYVAAVEVPQGGLDALLMVAGSRLELLATPCPD